ncbi:helix-turn-helix domain-containing protein [Priestia sp. JV24]|uniref:helix-turn-helix domain-containing protein n=1 Tax=Priestia TaxID=2800373 RepID=UPI0021D670D8|nr:MULTISPECIES: helix-turn-helix domain-containing protein [Priestia]MCU7713069.1 helix-turn-helix domain-containing protein [Priestia megaterium]MCW1049194.1 helix-turn-helix domain-containing protein [Priestia sp. JV24]
MKELNKYTTFKNKEAFNEHVNEILREAPLNKTERLTLQTLAKYSVKYLGVSWMKIETLAKAIGKSVDTVKKILRKLVQMKIINRIPQDRNQRGRFGAWVTVFSPKLPAVFTRGESEKKAEKPCHNSVSELDEKLDTIILKQNTLDLDTQQQYEEKLAVQELTTKSFYKLVKPYLQSSEIFKLYNYTQSIYRTLNSKYGVQFEYDSKMTKTAVKRTVIAYKSRRIQGKFENYYYSVLADLWDKKYNRHLLKLRRKNKCNLHDWLSMDNTEMKSALTRLTSPHKQNNPAYSRKVLDELGVY